MVTRVLVVALVVASLGASAFAVGFMGPPTAELKAGQWNVGYSFSYSRQDLEKVKVKWSEYYLDTDDEEDEDSGSYKVTPEDATLQRHYAVLGYGVCDQWEVYGQLGIADLKANVKDDDDDIWGINFDNDFAWGVGTRVTLVPQNPDGVAWGVSAQANWIDTSADWSGSFVDEEEGEEGTWKEKAEVEVMEILVAFGPTIDMVGWKLYGGPYYYYLSGDSDATYSEEGTWDNGEGDTGSWIYSSKDSSDYEAASNFGGFIGAIFNLADNCKATIEGQMHGDGWGAGTSIMWTF